MGRPLCADRARLVVTANKDGKLGIRKKDVYSCLLFIILWLLPVMYTGLVNRDVLLLPRTLCYLHRISFLFTHGTPVWTNYYIQGLPEDSNAWVTLPESDYFRLQPFGYRTRLHAVLSAKLQHYALGYPQGQGQQQAREAELARWISQRYNSTRQRSQGLEAVRFMFANSPLGDNASISGHWRKPALDSFQKRKIHVLSVHDVRDREGWARQGRETGR